MLQQNKRMILFVVFLLKFAEFNLKPVDTLFTEWRLAKGLPFKPHMTFKDYDK